jgi:hypothetical protein
MSRRPRRYPASVRLAALPIAGLCALVLAGCGDTLQDRPISHSILEGMIVAPYPVYWLGGSFQGLAITEGAHDPSGSFSLQYGDCIHGGQGTCTPPLRIVTSPDNGFVPGGSTPASQATIRGISARVSESGRTIAIPTGGVVVSIFGKDPPTAAAAAQAMVAINAIGSPGQSLPARLPDTGYGSTPLSSELPSAAGPLN